MTVWSMSALANHLECAVTQNAPVSPLPSALAKSRDLNTLVISTCRKARMGSPSLLPCLFASLPPCFRRLSLLPTLNGNSYSRRRAATLKVSLPNFLVRPRVSTPPLRSIRPSVSAASEVACAPPRAQAVVREKVQKSLPARRENPGLPGGAGWVANRPACWE